MVLVSMLISIVTSLLADAKYLLPQPNASGVHGNATHSQVCQAMLGTHQVCPNLILSVHDVYSNLLAVPAMLGSY